MYANKMKLLALPHGLLLLLSCRTVLPIFTKSDLKLCASYYDMYSQIQQVTLSLFNLCSLKCYLLGESCPRFHYDSHKKLCKLSVLNNASSVRKPVQDFVRNFVHKVSCTTTSCSSLFSLEGCRCVSGTQLLVTNTTPRVRLCELQPYLE